MKIDNSVPYREIIMLLPPGESAIQTPPPLAEGYTIRGYQPGDERHWARIETSVAEFPCEAEALEYFTSEFMPQSGWLPRRMFFACDNTSAPVANAAAWELEGKPCVHWVACHPAHQGQGLARALTCRCIGLLAREYPGQAIMLHTQTTSHAAIRLYHSLGFCMVRASDWGKANQFEEALAVLRTLYPEPLMREIEQNAR